MREAIRGCKNSNTDKLNHPEDIESNVGRKVREVRDRTEANESREVRADRKSCVRCRAYIRRESSKVRKSRQRAPKGGAWGWVNRS